ncbi:MAG: transglutaminase family protein [Devosia sp.]
MRITVRHELTYSLGNPARALAHVLMTPLATVQQKVERWSIDMPGIASAAVFRDAYGNRAHLVNFTKVEGDITILVEGLVETSDKAGVLGRVDHDPMAAIYRRPTALTKADPALIDGLDKLSGVALLHELMDRVHNGIGGTAQSQSQDGQSQSQRNSEPAGLPAHRFIGAARALGLPARYVTGYVLADEDEPAAFRGWAEVWDDGLGWIGFDPVANLCPADGHVRLASAFDVATALPARFHPAPPTMPAETVSVTAAD